MSSSPISPAALYAELRVVRDQLTQQLAGVEKEMERLDDNQRKLLTAVTGDAEFDNPGLLKRVKEIEQTVEEVTGLKLKDMRKFLDNYKAFQKSLLWLAAAVVPVGSALVWAILNMDRIIELFGS